VPVTKAEVAGTPPAARDRIEPASVVAAMASAVERVRRMATTVFKGDAALFAESAHDTSTEHCARRAG
jgi:precorrin-6B methylase 1